MLQNYSKCTFLYIIHKNHQIMQISSHICIFWSQIASISVNDGLPNINLICPEMMKIGSTFHVKNAVSSIFIQNRFKILIFALF